MRIRPNITTKLIGVLVILTFVCVFDISIIAVYSMSRVGRFAENSSLELGSIAAKESAAALQTIGEGTIRQKTGDVARQVQIYLEAHPYLTRAEIMQDFYLRSITLQYVGENGYTLLYGRDGVMLHHVNQELVGFDMSQWAERLPAFWGIFKAGLEGDSTGGYYDWPEPDGSMRSKYMYVSPVAGTDYVVATTTYLDEFLQPSGEIRDRINAATSASSQYIDRQNDNMILLFIATAVVMLAAFNGVALLLARTITKPILALTEGARALGRGQLDYRVGVHTKDELEELAGQFNMMASAVKESHLDLERRVEERTRAERRRAEQLRALNELGRKISSIMSLDELLPHVVTSFREAFQYSSVNILLQDSASGQMVLRATAGSQWRVGNRLEKKDGKSIVYWAAENGQPLLVNDVSQEPRYLYIAEMPDTRSELAVPISLGTELLGVLDIQSTELAAFDETDVFTVEALADEVAVAIDNARLYQNAREVAVLDERNRLAREIHDTLAQGFTGIVLQLEAAEQALEDAPGEVSQHLDTARRLARESLNEARRSVWALRPQALERLPLTETIQQAVNETIRVSKVKASFRITGDRRSLPPNTEDALLRICQEALTNVHKHASASEIEVELRYAQDAIEMNIRDNGTGFDPQAPRSGAFGLISMRERVRLIDGIIDIESGPGQGTLLRVRVPTNDK